MDRRSNYGRYERDNYRVVERQREDYRWINRDNGNTSTDRPRQWTPPNRNFCDCGRDRQCNCGYEERGHRQHRLHDDSNTMYRYDGELDDGNYDRFGNWIGGRANRSMDDDWIPLRPIDTRYERRNEYDDRTYGTHSRAISSSDVSRAPTSDEEDDDDEEMHYDVETVNFPNFRRMEMWDYGFNNILRINMEKMTTGQPRNAQKYLVPMILFGHDIICISESGKEKTAGYAIPIFQNLLCINPNVLEEARFAPAPLAIVLAPTQEIVGQVAAVFQELAMGLGLKVVQVSNLNSYHQTTQEIFDGCEILVGTCGRVSRLISSGDVDLRHLRVLVVEEASRMIKRTPNSYRLLQDTLSEPKMQIVLPRVQIIISSTVSGRFSLLDEALRMDVSQMARVTFRSYDEKTVPVQFYKAKSDGEAMDHLSFILNQHEEQTVIFTNTRSRCQAVEQFLKAKGHHGATIHGETNAASRARLMHRFEEGEIKNLIATEGIGASVNLEELVNVVLVDLPNGHPQEVVNRFTRRIGQADKRNQDSKVFVLVDQSSEDVRMRCEAIVNYWHYEKGQKIPEWLHQIANVNESQRN